MNESYLVQIDAFEGPLDLLLHMINEYEIDIYDIPVAEITDQYNDYIKTMQQLELNVASEYLVMAATLLTIKSQMLLPKQQVDEFDEYEEDPREELIQRLIEYRKFKNSAEILKAKEQEANEVFMRKPIIFNDEFYKPEVMQGEQSIYDMLRAFDRIQIRKKLNQPFETTVTRVEISIEQRMEEVMHTIHSAATSGISFDQLFIERTRTRIVITFIAILELMKDKKIYCEQEESFDALYIYESN